MILTSRPATQVALRKSGGGGVEITVDGRLAGIAKLIAAGGRDEVISRDGLVEPDRLSGVLRVSKGELAAASELSRDAVSKTIRLRTPATQAWLREVAEIINRILPWCGSVPQAFAWYRSQPIPAFGDQTAEEVVSAGRAEHLKGYLAGIAIGGYA